MSLSVECKLKTWVSDERKRKKSKSRLSGSLSQKSVWASTVSSETLFFLRQRLLLVLFPSLCRSAFEKEMKDKEDHSRELFVLFQIDYAYRD